MRAASNVSATIQADAVPQSGAFANFVSKFPQHGVMAFTGGDDYEILFAVPAEKAPQLESASANLEFKLSRLGKIESAGSGITVLDREGTTMSFSHTGYTHFGENH